MDRKAILAIVLCAAFLLLYRPLLHVIKMDRFLEAPRPARVAVDSTVRDTSGTGTIAGATSAGTFASPNSPPFSIGTTPPTTSSRAVLERIIAIETPLYRATFTDHGARLLSVEIKHYASAHGASSVNGRPRHLKPGEVVPSGDRVVLGGSPLLALDLGAPGALRSLAALTYAVAESVDASGQKRVLSFTAQDSSGLRIRQTYRVDPSNFALGLEVELHGVPAAWRVSDYSIATRSWPAITEADTLADTRALRASSLVGTNLKREHIGALLKGPKRLEGSAVWAAVQSRYFISAVAVDAGSSRGVVSYAERATEGAKVMAHDRVANALVMGLPADSHPIHRFVLYVGPSEYFRLSAAGHELARAVDLGWHWVLPFSRALLQLLKWLFGVLHNYGLAIIAIATLVRLVLHPLNMMSMKSMRAMQRLQPELERIREKYKEDPTAMNTAVMALYKDNKVNPAGGCLPMVLQMPLFIALYQVLFNAIELRQAPFVAWIDDLSAPDLLLSVAGFPIRLLPVLMLGSGLLAQMMTPSDPRQRPTMYMMNVVMLVFFYNLPSGLVLYWTIMNVLTALQQWMILRQDVSQPATVVASVVAPRRTKGRKPARS